MIVGIFLTKQWIITSWSLIIDPLNVFGCFEGPSNGVKPDVNMFDKAYWLIVEATAFCMRSQNFLKRVQNNGLRIEGFHYASIGAAKG